MRPLRACSLVLAVLLIGGSTAGCPSPTPPARAPQQYDRLVKTALAQARARADTSLFWLRNTGPAPARSLMLDLGVDYLRYDRGADVLCVWTGEGLWPARGYVTAPAAGRAPTDGVGRRCNIEGTCTVAAAAPPWGRFECR